jgi:hypothetical protein
MIIGDLKQKRLVLVRAGLAALAGALVIATSYAPHIDAKSEQKPSLNVHLFERQTNADTFSRKTIIR